MAVHRRVLLVSPTASGKTACFSYIASGVYQRQKRVLILAHRKELIRQIGEALDAWLVPFGVVGRDRKQQSVMIGNVFTVVRRLAKIETPDLIIVDECFPAGTLVDGKNIESLRIGDHVRSFNHETSEIEFQQVKKIFRSRPSALLKVSLSNGKTVVCTPGHPFFVDGQYVPAICLKQGHMVSGCENVEKPLMCSLRRPDSHTEQHPSEILLSRMSGRRERQDESGRIITTGASSYRETKGRYNSVRSVWKNGAGIRETPVYGIERKGILLTGMLNRVPEAYIVSDNGENKSKIRGGKDGEPQPHASGRQQRTDAIHTEGDETPTAPSRWQWSAGAGTATEDVGSAGVADGNCPAYENGKGKRISKPLQNRYSECSIKNSNRSGWRKSYRPSAPRAGRAQGRILTKIRVDSIEVIEPTSDGSFGGVCRDGHVYNIEVESNHNYFAEGVLVHNCHHATAGGTWGRIIESFPNARVIGVTATPCRLDGRGLAENFDTMVMGPSVAELTELGWLSPTEVYAPSKPDLRGVKKRMGDYIPSALDATMNKPVVTGNAVQHYLRICPGATAIAFCVSIAHAKAVAEEFRSFGIAAESVDGEMSDTARDAALNGLRDGRVKVVTSCMLISEGFDVPAVDCVVLLRPTKSLGLYLQMVGRGIRVSPGKTTTIVMDHAGLCVEHGFVDEPREWTLDGGAPKTRKSAAAVRTCPKCFAAHRPTPVCPMCGFAYIAQGREDKIDFVAGDLVKVIDPKSLTKQDLFGTDDDPNVSRKKEMDYMTRVARQRGYRNPEGWAYVVVRAREAKRRTKAVQKQARVALGV